MRAFITGPNGQDGKYLSLYLKSIGYEVYEYNGDILDTTKLSNEIKSFGPKELYHLAAASSFQECVNNVEHSIKVNCIGTANILNILGESFRSCKFFNASSCEIFGNPIKSPQDESCPHNPTHPYAFSKSYSTNLTNFFRDSIKLYAVNGIMYNHTSPFSSYKFVTKKIAGSVASIYRGYSSVLYVGNIETVKDFGFSRDYMRAAHLTLQQPIPDNYIICSGELVSIREILDIAFSYKNMDYRDFIKIDSNLYRKSPSAPLVGNASKIRDLGWKPEYTIKEIIERMVDYELSKI